MDRLERAGNSISKRSWRSIMTRSAWIRSHSYSARHSIAAREDIDLPFRRGIRGIGFDRLAIASPLCELCLAINVDDGGLAYSRWISFPVECLEARHIEKAPK